MKKAIITALAAGALAIGAAYVERGYWAVGCEWLVPLIVAAIMPLRDKEEEYNK